MVEESWRTGHLKRRDKTQTLWLNSKTIKKMPNKICVSVCMYWKGLKLKLLKGIFVVAKALKWQIWNGSSWPCVLFSLKTSNKAYFFRDTHSFVQPSGLGLHWCTGDNIYCDKNLQRPQKVTGHQSHTKVWMSQQNIKPHGINKQMRLCVFLCYV